MVGFVIVSHSKTLAEGVVELTKMMADGVPIRAAGGLEDGSFGTSFALFMPFMQYNIYFLPFANFPASACSTISGILTAPGIAP